MEVELINTLRASRDGRVSRKYVLDPLARLLGINPRKYKRWHQLKDAILNSDAYSRMLPSGRCENASDPVTLDLIDDIDPNMLFEWIQNGKRYAADIRSLYHMINLKGHVWLPWAIDTDSGVSFSFDCEGYIKRYDLKAQDGLVQKINEHADRVGVELTWANPANNIENGKYRFERHMESFDDNAHGSNSFGQYMYTDHIIRTIDDTSPWISSIYVVLTIEQIMIYFNRILPRHIRHTFKNMCHRQMISLNSVDHNTDMFNVVADFLTEYHDSFERDIAFGIMRYFVMTLGEIIQSEQDQRVQDTNLESHPLIDT